MENKVIKQHWMPRMLLKEWIDQEDNLNYFSLEKKEFQKLKYNRNKKKFANDPFYIKEMYERAEAEYNKTENLLSWIEREFEDVKQKIKKSSRNYEIKLNRRDIEILKTFINTMTSRTKSIFDRLENSDGDILFKYKMSKLTMEERKKILFDNIDNNVILQIEKLKTDPMHPNENVLRIQNIIENSDFGFMQLNKNTSIKIFSSSNSSFIMTDQFSSNIVNPIPPGGFLIGFFPISPKICIGLLYENGIHRDLIKNGTEDFFSNGKKYVTENLGIKHDKFFKFDGKCNYVNEGKLNYEDVFTYKNNYLSDEETSIVNAFLSTQSTDIITFEKNKDLHDSFEAEKKYGIFRGEDQYKNLDEKDYPEKPMMDIYNDQFSNEQLQFAIAETLQNITKMIQKNYLSYLTHLNSKNIDDFSIVDIIGEFLKNTTNYQGLQNLILSLMFDEQDLKKDMEGDYCLSDNSIKDPEKIIMHNFSFIWKIICDFNLDYEMLKNFKNIGEGTKEQGKLNGPDWIFEYDNFRLGVEITSNIIPIFTSVAMSNSTHEKLEAIKNSILKNIDLDEKYLDFEWRPNRFEHDKLDLLIRKKLDLIPYEELLDTFRNIVKIKIEKKKHYQVTDELALIIQASDFAKATIDDEGKLFQKIESDLNSEFSNFAKIYIY